MKNLKKTFALAFVCIMICVSVSGCGAVTEPDAAIDASANAAVVPASSSIEFVMNDNMQSATYSKKVDGDTAYFIIDDGSGDNEIKVRFLAIDTPETVKSGTEVQEWGPEASEYTDSRLKSADEIYLEWDDASDIVDKYDRYLAWIWVDGSLLEEELVSLGYARVAYIYADYKYVDELYSVQDTAKKNELGIWSSEE